MITLTSKVNYYLTRKEQMMARKTNSDIALRIARYIDDKGIKQNVIATAIDVSPQTLSQTLLGKRTLTADEYGDICKFLGVPYDQFFANDEVA